MKQCENCHREIKRGRFCQPCYDYRRVHGVPRPLELETQRQARGPKGNPTHRCLNCDRPIATREKLCHTCYMWKQRHNGEMRPVENEERLRHKRENEPVAIIAPKCQRCASIRGAKKRKFTECRSCHTRRLWREGKYANRKIKLASRIKEIQWTETHVRRLRELAGNYTVEEIATKLTDEFGIERTPRSIYRVGQMYGISVVCFTGYTQSEIHYLLGLNKQTLKRLVDLGVFQCKKNNTLIPSNSHWRATDKEVETLLHRMPYLFDSKKIKNPTFRSIIETEYKRDSWVTLNRAAEILGVARSAVSRYITEGKLVAVPENLGPGRTWHKRYIRRSVLYTFMKNRDEVKRERTHRKSGTARNTLACRAS